PKRTSGATAAVADANPGRVCGGQRVLEETAFVRPTFGSGSGILSEGRALPAQAQRPSARAPQRPGGTAGKTADGLAGGTKVGGGRFETLQRVAPQYDVAGVGDVDADRAAIMRNRHAAHIALGLKRLEGLRGGSFGRPEVHRQRRGGARIVIRAGQIAERFPLRRIEPLRELAAVDRSAQPIDKVSDLLWHQYRTPVIRTSP